MKKQILMAVLIASLAFTACNSSSKKEGADSASATEDTMVSKDGTTGTDTSGAPATGGSSSAAIGGFDTARAKMDTANTTPNK